METLGMVTIPVNDFELLVRENQRLSLLIEKAHYDKAVLEEKISLLKHTIIPLLEK